MKCYTLQTLTVPKLSATSRVNDAQLVGTKGEKSLESLQKSMLSAVSDATIT